MDQQFIVVVCFVHYVKCVRSTRLNKYEEIEEIINIILFIITHLYVYFSNIVSMANVVHATFCFVSTNSGLLSNSYGYRISACYLLTCF